MRLPDTEVTPAFRARRSGFDWALSRARNWCAWFIAVAALFPSYGSSAAENQPAQGREIPLDDIFAGTNVLRLRILIPNSGMSALRNNSGWGNGQERTKVKAIVREGATVYTNVEIHLKGAAGSFRPLDDNPGLTLNFEKNAPGQTFHGYH